MATNNAISISESKSKKVVKAHEEHEKWGLRRMSLIFRHKHKIPSKESLQEAERVQASFLNIHSSDLNIPSVITDFRALEYGENFHGDQLPATELWNEVSTPWYFKVPCFNSQGVLKGKKISTSNISLIEYFHQGLQRFKQRRNHVAIQLDEYAGEKLTYRYVDTATNAVANLLKACIFENGAVNKNPDNDIVIGICLHVGLEFVYAVLATLKLGATYFPINPMKPVDKILAALTMVQPVLLITNASTRHVFAEHQLDDVLVLNFEALWTTLEDHNTPLEQISKGVEPIPYLESGVPKFQVQPNKHVVPLCDRYVAILPIENEAEEFKAMRYKSSTIFAWIQWEYSLFKVRARERILLTSQSDTAAGLIELFSPLLRGNVLVLLNQQDMFSPIRLMEKIKAHEISRINLPPEMLHAILRTIQLIGEEKGLHLVDSVKYWFCISGGSVSTETGELFFRLLPAPLRGTRLLVNMYGNDDDLGLVCYHILDNSVQLDRLSYQGKVPIGHPVLNTRIYVIKDDGRLARCGEVGEICVAGKMSAEPCAESYTSSRKWVKNNIDNNRGYKKLLRTGDHGRVIRPKFGNKYLVIDSFTYKDRHAHVGFSTVSLDIIEVHLKKSGMMRETRVICHRPGFEDQRLIAFCVCTEDKFPAVLEYLKRKLPVDFIPDLIEVPSIPLENGRPNDTKLLLKHYSAMLKRRRFNHWERLGNLPTDVMIAAEVLFHVIFDITGLSFDILASKFHLPFYKLPRTNHSKAILIIYELHKSCYPIAVSNFMDAESLEEIAYQMTEARITLGQFFIEDSSVTTDWRYRIETMTYRDKNEVIPFLCKILTRHDSLDYYNKTPRQEIRKFLDSIWFYLIHRKISKLVRRMSDGLIVGALLCVDWHDQIPSGKVVLSKDVSYRFQLMYILESGFERMRMSSTETSAVEVILGALDDQKLSHLDCYAIMDRLIGDTVKAAESLGVDAVVDITFNYFVTDICQHHYRFQVLQECQVNQFVASDGHQPYKDAPDGIVASLCVYKCGSHEPHMVTPQNSGEKPKSPSLKAQQRKRSTKSQILATSSTSTKTNSVGVAERLRKSVRGSKPSHQD